MSAEDGLIQLADSRGREIAELEYVVETLLAALKLWDDGCRVNPPDDACGCCWGCQTAAAVALAEK